MHCKQLYWYFEKTEYNNNRKVFIEFSGLAITDDVVTLASCAGVSKDVNGHKFDPGHDMASKFVLIGDEDKSNQFAVEKVLMGSGIDSVSAASGKEVQGIYESDPNRWALIILSCELPDIDGYETARAIREFEKNNNIDPVNIIGISDNADQQFISKTQVAGMNGSMEKPLDRRQLLDMVSKLFAVRKTASSLD